MRKLFRVGVAALVVAGMSQVVGAFAATSRAAATPAKVDRNLVAELRSAKATDRLTVFVQAGDVATAKRAVAASHLTLVDTFDRVATAVAVGTPAHIRSVTHARGVRWVEADRPIEFHSATAHQATRYDEARADTAIAAASDKLDGEGTTIAIVDSGIDGTHPMFQEGGRSKVVRNLKLVCHQVVTACVGPTGDANDDLFVDFTTLTNDTDNGGGHGTHVAGIAAGNDVTTGGGLQLHGAAPKAKLVGLSVGQTLSVYGGNAGLNWVLEHHDQPCVSPYGVAYSDPVDCPPIRAVNNSYGPTGGGEFDSSSITVALQRQLVNAGIAVVWSAGNGDATGNGGDGSDVRTNPPGQDPTYGVIMVANYDDDGTGNRDNIVDPSSSRGMKDRPETYPDVSAPGTGITSACRPYLPVCHLEPDTGDADDVNYAAISGTSMASPYVAGVVATLMAAKPGLTPGQAELAIEDTAHHFAEGAPYGPDDPSRNPNSDTSFDKGHGLIDVRAALNKVLGISVVLPPPGTAICTADGPVAVDVTGDAKDFAVRGAFPVNEPGLDLTRVDVASNADHDIIVTDHVDDLGAANPDTSPHVAFDNYFTFDGQDFWIEASRAADGTVAGKFGATIKASTFGSTRLPYADLAEPTFDAVNNAVTVILPSSVLAEFATRAPVDNDSLTAIDTVSRRAFITEPESQGQSADDATAKCPFTFGLGAIPPPPPTPTPPPPYTPPPSEGIASVGSDFEWTAGPFSSDKLDGVDGDCTRDEVGPGCDRHGVTVNVPPGGGELTVDVFAEDVVDDIDVYVYAPDGTDVGNSALPTGFETVTARVEQPGVYTIVVTTFAQNFDKYDGTVSIKPAEAPHAAEGTVSAGSPYAWDGAVPVPVNAVFACSPGLVGDAWCDNHYVQVNVPTGTGHHLTVTAASGNELESHLIYVYGPDGKEIDVGDNRAGFGTWTVPVTTSGVYRISVTALVATEGYHGTASVT